MAEARLTDGYSIIKRSTKFNKKLPKDILKDLGITPLMAMVWFLHKKIGFEQKEIARELGLPAYKICRIYKKSTTVLNLPKVQS